ncbi:CidA/LrgA family protein [Staphylococcus arlettae]|uniref:CidA/LrgA family protein n=1 Tax=Staphylococcus arlettae TaxID=29378 RepID=UPI001E2C2CCE|nr:CidA/LrgA family protein [Staphylococcus arlettae]MCD8838506.1 CidA/LrgA family protein [Staphylococcus arlettae]MCD8866425.1 CidA/LrgA family protein [Staphylococcus arlettae]
MKTITTTVIIMSQILVIMCVTYLGSIIQKAFHLPIASSIVGLIIFFLLLKFKIIPEKWIDKGAHFLLATMIFFFIPSAVGLMDVVSIIDSNFILFFALIIVSTLVVAIISGYVAEKMLAKSNERGEHQ